jgi:hypothetical protein
MRRMMFDIMFSILSRHESKPYATDKNARWFSLRKACILRSGSEIQA